MSDPVYDYALALREELAKKINDAQQGIEAMRQELRAVEAFLQQYSQLAARSQGVASVASDDTSASKPRVVYGVYTRDSAPTHLKNSKKEEVARVAREILAEQDKPMPRKALLKAVTERGIILSGKDPEMVLSTMMWRMQKEFVRLPPWGYWLKDRPYVPAGYDPLIPYPGDDEHSEMVQSDLAGTLPESEG
jgi:hypothetical protein